MNNVILMSIIALISIVFWILIASLIRKIWSFRKKKETKTKSGLSKSTNNTDSSGSMFGIFIFVIFIIFFVGIVFISFKMTMARYKIAGDAIKQGNTGVAAAIMAPEIGQGISSGLSGLRRNIRH